MIKLNNKNITYVALADTNNSIKAPKEIWYADSNNSVKLVYRRKDALIEGEDYEKYHWLVGDADAYINTLKYYRPYDDSVQMTFRDNLYPNRADKRNKHNTEEQIWGSSINNDGLIIRSYISGTTDIGIGNNILNAAGSSVNWFGYTINGYINDSEYHNLYISNVTDNKYSFTYNGSQKDNLSTINTLPNVVQSDVLVFSSNRVPNGYFNGSFFNFIHYRNNVEITHLIPCKLLKPVPKWLDANGIRRQVGECGMIDLVSGKFYGNVNSNGTFTVENYYERKEWLVGDGSAYITLDVNIYRETISAVLYPLPAGGSEKYAWMYSYSVANAEIRAYVDKYDRFTIRQGLRVNNTAPQLCYSQLNGEFDITIKRDTDTNTIFVVNGDTRNVSVPCDDRFDITSKISLICDGTRVKTFETDNYNLIPCTLTMDLPASMDANNIARTKGTSGMWDLVSDKFYGNVASSGTFKAVNLAEGVDYEVHQWLVGDGSAYIDTGVTSYNGVVDIKLSVGSFVGTILGRTLGNDGDYSKRFFVGRYTSYGIYGNNQAPSTLIVNDSVLLTIDIDNSIATDNYGNTTSISIIGNVVGNSMYLFCANKDNVPVTPIFNGKIGLFNISSIINLIPVKLIRPIPSKYDANGIARQAGECGMYDTVNDKFYGNVASSGTFSVEDDS